MLLLLVPMWLSALGMLRCRVPTVFRACWDLYTKEAQYSTDIPPTALRLVWENRNAVCRPVSAWGRHSYTIPSHKNGTKFLTLSNQMASSLFSEYFMVGLVGSSIYCLTWATLILQMKGYWNQAWRDRLECNVNEGYNVVHVHTKNRKKQPTYFCISLPTTVRI